MNYLDDLRHTIFNVKVMIGVLDPVYVIEFASDFADSFKERATITGFIHGGHLLVER